MRLVALCSTGIFYIPRLDTRLVRVSVVINEFLMREPRLQTSTGSKAPALSGQAGPGP